MINLIAAVARNGVIGRDNDLAWYLPTDLQHFKQTTSEQAIVMGTNTWRSLRVKPLPKRANVIVSRSGAVDLSPDLIRKAATNGASIVVVPSLELALKTLSHADKDIWIIGGAQLYTYALKHDLVDRMVLSEVLEDIEGDTYFPKFSGFEESERVEIRDDTMPYDIVTYLRKRD